MNSFVYKNFKIFFANSIDKRYEYVIIIKSGDIDIGYKRIIVSGSIIEYIKYSLNGNTVHSTYVDKEIGFTRRIYVNNVYGFKYFIDNDKAIYIDKNVDVKDFMLYYLCNKNKLISNPILRKNLPIYLRIEYFFKFMYDDINFYIKTFIDRFKKQNEYVE